MRILLALALMAALAGCGKKKPAASPASPAAESTEKSDDAVKDQNTPDEGEDSTETKSADPQEGGQ
jgi:predicted small lipoprotein YifL